MSILYRTLLLSIALTYISVTGGNAQNLSRYATKIEGIDADKLAIYIEDLKTGDVILDVNGEEPMIPASVTKLITAATAFQIIDLDDTYKTIVESRGEITNGTLNGDILIYAVGDPTLESSHFPQHKGVADSIANAISKSGIASINGKIIVESPEWLDEPIPSGWVSEDVNWPYGAGHHALNYADNRFILTYSSPSNYKTSPSTPGVKFISGSKNGSVWRARESSTYNVGHRGKKALSISLANPLPQNALINAIKESLENKGIEVKDTNIKPLSNLKHTIYVNKSPKIYDILRNMILWSDNQMAEAMLRYPWPESKRNEAVKKELDLWNKLGIDTNDITLEDGSGLSRKDRLTAYTLADILAWMVDNDDNFAKFINMLPHAGKSGTLKSFLKGTELEGRLRAKTGSMNGVQCYAGYYVDTIGSPTHIVVIMVNGFKGDRTKLKSRLENILIEYLL